MNQIRDRVKEQVPSVLLTLLSIVQALALELLWSHVLEAEHLYRFDTAAVIGWAQALAVFLTIIVVWLVYASSAMRFRWLPATAESVYPFVIGIGEFVLVEMSTSERLAPWLIVMALLFAAMHRISHTTLRRARAEPENREVFSHVAPAQFRDFYPVFATVGCIAAAGLLAASIDLPSLLELVVVLAINGLLLWQLHLSSVFWNRTTAAARQETPQP